jgi:choline dehydrogenase
METEVFDYVIVGAGSAGSVLANRLTEDGRHRVLLLEYGGSDRSLFIQMPSALSIPMNMPKYDWGYETEPEPGLGGRRLHCPRGKVIGGSSSINGMVYIRGNPLDFDRWEEEGARGWGYRHVLPYFRRAECREEGGNEYRGDGGPLHTSYGRLANPLYRVFIEAAKAAGYPETADVNGYQQEGFGRFDMTVHRGVRWSAAHAYLRPALRRSNLVLRTYAAARRILFEGKRAVGLRYFWRGREREVRVGREVILSAGPIASPQLLKLSGVGPAEELRAFEIPVVHHLPGVGENLQDHLEFYFQMACTQPITLYKWMSLPRRMMIALQWLLFRNGLGATNHFETGGFIRSRPGIKYPDIQIISCRSPSLMTARPLPASMDFRSMSGRCARRAAAMCGLPRRIPRPDPVSASTISAIPTISSRCGPVCVSPVRSLPRRLSIPTGDGRSSRGRMW